MAHPFEKLTRGGKLTIVNCALWGIVALGLAVNLPVLLLPALVVCWPVAWLFVLPTMGDRSRDAGVGLVVACVAIGANSLLWGYGISWLMSLWAAMYRRAGSADAARRGFEVITAAPAEGDRESYPR